jgi:hypothetical protein
VTVLDVKKCPVPIIVSLVLIIVQNGKVKRNVQSNHCINNSQASIERQLRDLGSWKLAICIPKLHHSFIILTGVSIRAHTVVACLFHGIVDRVGTSEVYCFRNDLKLGGIGCVRRKKERAELIFRAEVGFYAGLIAD